MRTFDEINDEIRSAHRRGDSRELLVLAQEMEELNTTKAEAIASITRGVAYSSTGEYGAALSQCQRGRDLCRALGDRSGEVQSISTIARVYASTGDYQSALEHFRSAMALSEELNDHSSIATIADGMGLVYVHVGDFPSALVHFRRALDLYEQHGDRAGIGRVTGNMGIVYAKTADYPSALELYQRALAVHEENGHRTFVAIITANMAIVYASIGDYGSAIEQFKRSLTLHQELGNRGGVADAIGNMGILYQQMDDYASAFEYMRQAVTMSKELGDDASEVFAVGNLITALLDYESYDEASELLEYQATMRMDAPEIRAQHHGNRASLAEHALDLEAAKTHLHAALDVVVNAGDRENTALYHKRLRDLAQKQNDFAGYIEHNNEFTRITEEIRGREATQRIALLEADRRIESELRKRDKERALLYSALPESVATRMVSGESVTGDNHEHATVIFLDIVGFTAISDSIPAGHVVHLLSQIFTTLDVVCKNRGVTKIKTIGDSYMAVAFSNTEDQKPKTRHVVSAGLCAVEMLSALNALEITMPPELGETSWTKDVGDIQVRIGIHCGPVTAGVIGTERMQYDVWGDTVNVASRMESSGEAGRIHVSEAFASTLLLNDSMTNDSMTLLKRGEIDIKGKGPMTTYWLEAR